MKKTSVYKQINQNKKVSEDSIWLQKETKQVRNMIMGK